MLGILVARIDKQVLLKIANFRQAMPNPSILVARLENAFCSKSCKTQLSSALQNVSLLAAIAGENVLPNIVKITLIFLRSLSPTFNQKKTFFFWSTTYAILTARINTLDKNTYFYFQKVAHFLASRKLNFLRKNNSLNPTLILNRTFKLSQTKYLLWPSPK